MGIGHFIKITNRNYKNKQVNIYLNIDKIVSIDTEPYGNCYKIVLNNEAILIDPDDWKKIINAIEILK